MLETPPTALVLNALRKYILLRSVGHSGAFHEVFALALPNSVHSSSEKQLQQLTSEGSCTRVLPFPTQLLSDLGSLPDICT